MTVHVLAISGSLRAGSSNSAIVQAAVRVAPDGCTVTLFDALGALPPFNPDIDVEPFPESVLVWRDALQRASAVLISSPEYAHGVPGVLKNALDWVVGTGEFMEKPVALVNASAYSQYVTAQLQETLTVMMGRVVLATSLPLTGRPSTADDIMQQPRAAEALRDALDVLVQATRTAAKVAQ